MTEELISHLWQSTLFAITCGLLTLAFRKNRARSGQSFRQPAPCRKADRQPHGGLCRRADYAAGSFSSFFDSVRRQRELAADCDRHHLDVWRSVAGGIRLRSWRLIRASVTASVPIKIDCPIEIRASEGIFEPGIFGLIHPILLMPAGVAERLTPVQMDAVIAHELCHVRRRDNLLASIHMFIEVAFWFHPLVWWIGARLIEERERACDEEVVRQGNEPRDYAEGILSVCKSYVESPMRCVSGVTGSDLKKRIHAILAGAAVRDLNVLKKASLAIAAAVAVTIPVIVGMTDISPMQAQSTGSKTERFEVASVKACRGGGGADMKMGPPGGSPIVSPGRLNTGCVALAAQYPVAGLIPRAYQQLGLGHPVRLGSALPISGGPAWIYSDYYVINATAAYKASEETMEGTMLQALLEDRFKLKVHREPRQVPVYALTVAKGGPKLQASTEDCILREYPTMPLPAGKRYCRETGVAGRRGPNTTVDQEAITLDYLCKLLTLVLDRPIIDRTDISGRYNIKLEFAIDQTTPGVLPGFGIPSEDPPAPSIFTAVQQQLGLKLDAVKGAREFLVIDRVERPSEN